MKFLFPSLFMLISLTVMGQKCISTSDLNLQGNVRSIIQIEELGDTLGNIDNWFEEHFFFNKDRYLMVNMQTGMFGDTTSSEWECREDGQSIFEQYPIKDGLRQIRMTYKNDKPSHRANYKNEVLMDSLVYTYEDGVELIRDYWNDGVQYSSQKSYMDERGLDTLIEIYEKGRRVEYYRSKYDADMRLIRDEEYMDGELWGVWITNYTPASVEEISIQDGDTVSWEIVVHDELKNPVRHIYKAVGEEGVESEVRYEYIFDEKHNWISRIICSGANIAEIKREITYWE